MKAATSDIVTFQLSQLAQVVESWTGDFVNVLLHREFTVPRSTPAS